MFRVRLLWHASEGVADLPGFDPACPPGPPTSASLSALLRAKVRAASAKRRVCGLPDLSDGANGGGKTTAYRLVNSEGDGLSGACVDVFGSCAVVSSGAAWCEVWRREIEEAILTEAGAERVVWDRSESRLAQDGWATPPAEEEEEDTGGGGFFSIEDDDDDEGGNEAEKDGAVEILELGLKYAVSLEKMQKTGFYCDQVRGPRGDTQSKTKHYRGDSEPRISLVALVPNYATHPP